MKTVMVLVFTDRFHSYVGLLKPFSVTNGAVCVGCWVRVTVKLERAHLPYPSLLCTEDATCMDFCVIVWVVEVLVRRAEVRIH
jgi:hypothetical protein